MFIHQNEMHLVSFDMEIGQVIGTENMELGDPDDRHQSFSSNITCTTTWTLGPCEPHSEGVGITCYDTFTTYCYNTNPPLMIGFPVWNGSGGPGGGGSGNPGDQYLCDFDPNCVPHPDVQIDPTVIFEGYDDIPENFVLDSNPGVLDWQNSTSSQRFVHMVNPIYAAKLNGLTSLNLRNIFSNWPTNFQSGGPIKGGWANLSFNGAIIKVYYEIPVIEPWSIINVQGQRTTNGNNECVIEYSVSGGNLKSVWIVIPNSNLCNYYENLLL